MAAALITVCAVWALAEAGDACGPGDAAAHIARGHQRSDEGDDMAALAAYRCAHRLGGSAEALAQIGLAEMALGRWVEAEADLGRALAQEQDRWIRERRARLTAALEKIRDNLGDLLIEGSPPGAEILIDGRKAAELPLGMPLRVPTGRRDIHIRAKGYQAVSRERRIEARSLARETIELVRTSIDQPLPPPPPRQDPVPAATITGGPAPSPSRWPAWTAAALGVASLGVGVGSHVLREQYAQDFNARAECDDVPLTSQTCSDLRDDAQDAERLAIVGYAGAALFAATSIILFVASSPSAAAGHGHAIACGAGPGTFGLGCGGRF
jgi:hypothetical protein